MIHVKVDRRVFYHLIKSQIDQRGPLNYNNALAAATGMVEEIEEGDRVKRTEASDEEVGSQS